MAVGSHLWFSPLSHLLGNLWRNFVKTLHLNSSQCLPVSAQKRFRSVSKYGRTAAIFKITNCPLLNAVTIVIASPPGLLVRFFLTCLRCSPSGLVVQAWKWFPIDKYGRQQPSLIFTVIASPPKSLEEFCRNLAYEFLSMSRCVCLKMIMVCQQIWPNSGHL